MNRNLRKPDFDGDPDLEWTAFCYVADELTEQEKSAFENRLQEDHQAQLAVVAAMEQSQAIYVALSQSVRTSKPATVTSVSAAPSSAEKLIPRFLFAAAASLLLVVAGWGWYANQSDSESAVNANIESERLADAWVFTLVALNDDDWIEAVEEEPEDLDLGDESSEDWMYVALTDMESSVQGAE